MRLCTASGIYPRCLALQDIHYEATPVASGAFGDIWKGNHRNYPVCLKVPRVYQGSDVEHLIKVIFLLVKDDFGLILSFTDLHERSDYVESSQPS